MNIRKPFYLAVVRIINFFDFRKRDAGFFDRKKVGKVLVIPSTQIGDMYMSLPSIHAVIRSCRSENVVLLLNEVYRDVFDFPSGVTIIYRGKGWQGFLYDALKVYRQHCDVALILHANEMQHTPLAYMSGARFVFQLPNKTRFNYLLSNALPVRGWSPEEHASYTRYEVVKLIGISEDRNDFFIKAFCNEANRKVGVQAVNDIKSDRCSDFVIGLQLGASSKNRCWSISNYAHLVSMFKDFSEEYGQVTFVVLGGRDDLALAEELLKLTGSSVVSLVGKTKISELPGVISGMDFIVSPDTGTLHIAESMGTPVIGLFGVEKSKFSGSGYLGGKKYMIEKPQTCQPCLYNRCAYSPPACMEQIAVHEVFSLACNIIKDIKK